MKCALFSKLYSKLLLTTKGFTECEMSGHKTNDNICFLAGNFTDSHALI